MTVGDLNIDLRKIGHAVLLNVLIENTQRLFLCPSSSSSFELDVGSRFAPSPPGQEPKGEGGLKAHMGVGLRYLPIINISFESR